MLWCEHVGVLRCEPVLLFCNWTQNQQGLRSEVPVEDVVTCVCVVAVRLHQQLPAVSCDGEVRTGHLGQAQVGSSTR